jgi:hypothetical protein
MKTDTMRVLVDEELDYVAGGLSSTNLAGSVTIGPAEISFQDVGVNSTGGGISADLGGAYAEVGPWLSLSSHSDVGL